MAEIDWTWLENSFDEQAADVLDCVMAVIKAAEGHECTMGCRLCRALNDLAECRPKSGGE